MRRCLGFLAVVAALAFAAPARAVCPLYTVTTGPVLQYRFASTNGSFKVDTLDSGGAVGVNLAVNFAPNSNCTTRWFSVWGETLLGGGVANASAVATTATGTFDWIGAIGVGTLNDLLSFGVGLPFLSGSSTNPLNGIFIGKITAADLYFLVGFHITFEITPTGATVEAPYLPHASPQTVKVPVSDAPCSQRPGCVTL